MNPVISDQSPVISGRLSVISLGLRRPGIRPLWLLLLLIISVSILSSLAVAAPNRGPVIVVVANHLSLDDLLSLPNAARMMDHGAIALVNTGMQHTPALEARYLAMACGVRATDADKINFYESRELVEGRPAGEVYESQIGAGHLPETPALCIGFPKLLRANEQPVFREECIGLVGDAFHKAGLRTAAIGNSDTPDKPQRLAPLLAMDTKGLVDLGIIGLDAVSKDPNRLCGFGDDVRLLHDAVRVAAASHSLVVVELGDFNRLEALKSDISDQAYERYRARALHNLDLFMGGLMAPGRVFYRTLVLVSPVRAQSKGYWSNLSPMLVYGPWVKPGLLISATARTPGLVSNIDVAPTIIQAAALKVPDFVTGRPASPIAAEHAVERLQRMERIATRNYALQIPVLAGVGVLVVLSATLSEVVLRRRTPAWLRRALRAAFLIAFSLPGALLLTDGWEGGGISRYLLNLAIGILAVFGVSWAMAGILTAARHGKPVSLPGIMFVITAAFIAVDVLTGARLLRWSIVSADQITGIRYYGLGNEYMGLLIGTALVGALLLMRGRTDRKDCVPVPSSSLMPAAIWFALMAFVTGYPRFGANVGGLLTAVPAFGTAVMALMGIRIRARHVVGLLVLSFIGVAGCAVVDILSPGIGGSHLGRSIELARIYGWDWLGYLIGGKILMHLGILRLPQTYYPLLFSIPFFVMYGGRMKSEMVETGTTDLLYRVGVPSVLAGMATAFLFNDSGIVPAAFIMAIFVLAIQYLRLTEEKA